MPTFETKTEYLETIQRQTEANQLIVSGVKMVVAGGIEGLQEAAQTHPELIMNAITSLATIIDLQREQIVGMVEDYFEILDIIEKTPDTPNS